ncbi:TetR/AcrR family transcriptional regulator [Homoserinibacter sp. GY 40078]|uniref:TetR/AcrR family transcriptional regulator n=1 Tax=Homoserinibacter sp. GY 40078 TaxID=2603275 RepID=UPI0021036D50|nr:TetR/AcrR family transcriptional regulator C-terminal domain-containing protein [Homoserinibacter sp. GY 40078]
MTTTAGTQRIPLDRDRVLAAAVDLADHEGLDAISMRGLAAGLGVVPMALYKHVADKDDLIDGMVDTVVTAYAATDPALTGADAVRSRILAARRALVEHPWMRRAIETRTRRTPAVLAHMDDVAGAFLAAGYSVDLTHHAMHALGHRIWGFSPEAFEEPPRTPPTPAEQEATLRVMSERYPHITAIALDTATRNPSGACDEQDEFEFTLDLLLDAFARLRDAGWASHP